MKSINIAKFKSELSKYLGFVRKGEEIVVLDRKEPLARVIPFRDSGTEDLVVEEPQEDPNFLFKLKVKPIPKIATDSLRYLKEERSER